MKRSSIPHHRHEVVLEVKLQVMAPRLCALCGTTPRLGQGRWSGRLSALLKIISLNFNLIKFKLS